MPRIFLSFAAVSIAIAVTFAVMAVYELAFPLMGLAAILIIIGEHFA